MQTRIILAAVVLAALLVACGGDLSYEKQREYIDKCIIQVGPQTDRNNVTEYCAAMWRQSQREK